MENSIKQGGINITTFDAEGEKVDALSLEHVTPQFVSPVLQLVKMGWCVKIDVVEFDIPSPYGNGSHSAD